MPSGQVMYDGRWISAASDLGKEVAKFDQPNYNPEAHPYPKMLYKAERSPSGKVKCFEDVPLSHGFTDALLSKEQQRVEWFNRQNMKTVKNYEEHMEAKNSGWSEGPAEALAEFERRERAVGDEAARRALVDSKMSEKAQVEAKIVEDATEFHVAVIPEVQDREIPETKNAVSVAVPQVKVDKRTKAYKEAHRAGA